MKKSLCNQNLPEWARGWLAGLIDGEGTITVERLRRRKNNNINYRPLIVINNTSLELIQKVREVCSCGTISLHSPSYMKRFPQKRTVYSIKIKGSFNVSAILKQIYPYLIVKRKQAEIVLKICEENIKAYSTNKLANTKYLEMLKRELNRCNKRGK